MLFPIPSIGPCRTSALAGGRTTPTDGASMDSVDVDEDDGAVYDDDDDDELLVFDESTLPIVNAEGLDPDTLEPVTAEADGTGLRPGDVILMLDTLMVTAAAVTQCLCWHAIAAPEFRTVVVLLFARTLRRARLQ